MDGARFKPFVILGLAHTPLVELICLSRLLSRFHNDANGQYGEDHNENNMHPAFE